MALLSAGVARPNGVVVAVDDEVAVVLHAEDAVVAAVVGAGGPDRPAVVVEHEVAVGLHGEAVTALGEGLAAVQRVARVENVVGHGGRQEEAEEKSGKDDEASHADQSNRVKVA